MPIATALIYGVCFGTPILLAIIMKCFGSDITLFQARKIIYLLFLFLIKKYEIKEEF